MRQMSASCSFGVTTTASKIEQESGGKNAETGRRERKERAERNEGTEEGKGGDMANSELTTVCLAFRFTVLSASHLHTCYQSKDRDFIFLCSVACNCETDSNNNSNYNY